MFTWLITTVYAQGLSAWQGVETEDTPAGEVKVATFKALETIFSNILNIALTLGGIVVFVMLIIGGLNFLLSGGDPEKVKKSGQTLTWAIAGLFILVGIWFIFQLIEQFTGVTVTEFEVPGP